MAKRKLEDIRTNGIDGISIEYFCPACLHLRLSFRSENIYCNNCGNVGIITGRVGTLDKQALLKRYTPKKV